MKSVASTLGWQDYLDPLVAFLCTAVFGVRCVPSRFCVASLLLLLQEYTERKTDNEHQTANDNRLNIHHNAAFRSREQIKSAVYNGV